MGLFWHLCRELRRLNTRCCRSECSNLFIGLFWYFLGLFDTCVGSCAGWTRAVAGASLPDARRHKFWKVLHVLTSSNKITRALTSEIFFWQKVIRGSITCNWHLLRSIFIFIFIFIILAGHTRIYCMPFAPAASPHYRGAGTNFWKVGFFPPKFGGTGIWGLIIVSPHERGRRHKFPQSWLKGLYMEKRVCTNARTLTFETKRPLSLLD